MAWTYNDIETLKALWGEGKTAAQIATALGDGKSRNAVLGQARRLGLDRRPSPIVLDEPLPIAMVRKLHMRLHRLGLPSAGREAVLEAFAFTETGTPQQVARALGVPVARVEAILSVVVARYGWQAA